MPAASHAAPSWVTVSMLTGQTDGWTPDNYNSFSGKCSQRNNQSNLRILSQSIINSISLFTAMSGIKAKSQTSTSVFGDGHISTHTNPTSTRHAPSCVQEPKDNCWEHHEGGGMLANSSDFGLLGKQSSPKYVIPCLGRWWTDVQNLMLLALLSAEKSITIQTNEQKTHKQTVIDIFTPCL